MVSNPEVTTEAERYRLITFTFFFRSSNDFMIYENVNVLLKVEITAQSQCSANISFSRLGFEVKSYSFDWRVRNQNDFVHSVKNVVYLGSRSRFSRI